MSSAPPTGSQRRADAAKVKRQKQIVAVGSVILLALVGYQLPKALGGGDASSTAQPPAAPAQPVAAVPALPATLPDTDRVTVRPDQGQLISFGLFKSKDPFVQQLGQTTPAPAIPAPAVSVPAQTPVAPQTPATATTTSVTPAATVPSGPVAPPIVPAATAPTATVAAPVTSPATTTTPAAAPRTTTPVVTAPAPAPAATTPASTVPAATVPTLTVPASTPPASTTPASTTPASTTPTVPATTPRTVAIATNGSCEIVPLNGTFPGTEDIFRVTAIGAGDTSVKIALVGGSYQSGQPTATLQRGKTLTLVNNADGTRYVLELRTSCDVSTTLRPTTSTAALPVPPAPTTTATTPVVTDALDTTTPTGN